MSRIEEARTPEIGRLPFLTPFQIAQQSDKPWEYTTRTRIMNSASKLNLHLRDILTRNGSINDVDLRRGYDMLAEAEIGDVGLEQARTALAYYTQVIEKKISGTRSELKLAEGMREAHARYLAKHAPLRERLRHRKEAFSRRFDRFLQGRGTPGK